MPQPPCGGLGPVHTQRKSDNSLRARSRWQLKRRTLGPRSPCRNSNTSPRSSALRTGPEPRLLRSSASVSMWTGSTASRRTSRSFTSLLVTTFRSFSPNTRETANREGPSTLSLRHQCPPPRVHRTGPHARTSTGGHSLGDPRNDDSRPRRQSPPLFQSRRMTWQAQVAGGT